MANGNGSGNDVAKWLGISIDKWVSLFQSVGFPSLLVGFLLYAAWCYVPPVINGHIRLLERTGDTLESMEKTLEQSNNILGEVAEIQQQMKTFMRNVEEAHTKQMGLLTDGAKTRDEMCGKLDTIIQQTKQQ